MTLNELISELERVRAEVGGGVLVGVTDGDEAYRPVVVGPTEYIRMVLIDVTAVGAEPYAEDEVLA